MKNENESGSEVAQENADTTPPTTDVKLWPHCSEHNIHEICCLDCKTVYLKWKAACSHPGIKEVEDLEGETRTPQDLCVCEHSLARHHIDGCDFGWIPNPGVQWRGTPLINACKCRLFVNQALTSSHEPKPATTKEQISDTDRIEELSCCSGFNACFDYVESEWKLFYKDSIYRGKTLREAIDKFIDLPAANASLGATSAAQTARRELLSNEADQTQEYKVVRFRDGKQMAESGRVFAVSEDDALEKGRNLFPDCPWDAFRVSLISTATPPATGLPDKEVGLTFRELRKANIDRDKNEGGWHEIGNWGLNDWGVAVAGEVGEMLNIIKKIRRGDFPIEAVRSEIADELADIFTYLDLLANCAGIDVEQSLIRKFNEVSERIGSKVKLVASLPTKPTQ